MISIFPLWTFHLYVATFKQHLHNGVYISQLIRYSSAWGSYQDFLDRGLLLTRKLLNQGFLLVKSKSSLRKFYGRHYDLVDRYGIYLCHKWPRICSTCRKQFPIHDLSTGSVTRLTRRVPLVEQKLLILPDHLSSPPVLSGVRVTRSLVLFVCFVDRCLSFFLWPLCCLFFFDLRILITPLVYFKLFVMIRVIVWRIQDVYKQHVPSPLSCTRYGMVISRWRIVHRQKGRCEDFDYYRSL
jgi:hypothetical protein